MARAVGRIGSRIQRGRMVGAAKRKIGLGKLVANRRRICPGKRGVLRRSLLDFGALCRFRDYFLWPGFVAAVAFIRFARSMEIPGGVEAGGQIPAASVSAGRGLGPGLGRSGAWNY